MWRKILKIRNIAKDFIRVKVGNGRTTSFWYDKWSELGCILDVLGKRGFIDLGIGEAETVENVIKHHRRRRDRTQYLNEVEDTIASLSITSANAEDIVLWRQKENTLRACFKSKETWKQIRQTAPLCDWSSIVWFDHATPKFSFISWMAMKDRLTTGDKMSQWNGGANMACVFCNEPIETKEHLFFTCPFSAEVWENLTKGVLRSEYTNAWSAICHLMLDKNRDKTQLFVLRYLFQSSIHAIWRERNARRHGDNPSPALRQIKLLEKQMRNRLVTIQSQQGNSIKGGLQYWFSTRQ